MSTPHEKVFFTRDELVRAAGCIGAGSVTVRTLMTLTGIGEERARATLRVIADPLPFQRTGSNYSRPWALRQDWCSSMNEALRVQGTARLKGQNAIAVRNRLPMMPVYASGAPHHFVTDGMGRVVRYTGPERAVDARWQLDEEAA